jgi:hypothetical protein
LLERQPNPTEKLMQMVNKARRMRLIGCRFRRHIMGIITVPRIPT